MPQDHREAIEKSDTTAHSWLWQWNNEASEEQLRGLFGRLLFSKEQPFKKTSVLSGGETVRLLLAKLMLLKPNVLLLDEPTNHLDLEAIRSLTEALAKYEAPVYSSRMTAIWLLRLPIGLEMSNGTIRELSLSNSLQEFLQKKDTYKHPAAW